MDMSGQLPIPAALLPGKDLDTHWIEGWVGPRAGLDAVGYKKRKIPSLSMPGTEPQSSSPQPSHYSEQYQPQQY